MSETKDKSIVMHCYHCDNKTAFSICGELTYKIHPTEEEFIKINAWVDAEWDEALNDDEDYCRNFECNNKDAEIAHDEYLESVYYHQKKTFLLKCVSCSKPSVISIGQNISPGSITFAPFNRRYSSDEDNTPKHHDLDSFVIDGYVVDILYPRKRLGPEPSAKMPKKVAQVFEEARTVYNSSPRASAALLRLALQILLKDLGLPGKNINEDIKRLVKHELIRDTQQALDIIRIIGNNSVHPSEINLNEDAKTVLNVFELINFIVDQLITRPGMIREMYSKLPENDKKNIMDRDNKK